MDQVLRYMSEEWCIADLKPARLVCTAWRNILDSSGLVRCTRDEVDAAKKFTDEIKLSARLISACHDAVHDMGHEAPNLSLIWDTAVEIEEVLRTTSIFSASMHRFISVRNVRRQLEGTAQLMSSIYKLPKLDILDLGLRRRLQEMQLAGQGSACIASEPCMISWNRAFGPRAFYVSWEDFRHYLVLTHDDTCAKHARAFACFPSENTVSCYAYHLLSRLYGTYPETLWLNFSHLLGGRGFVGIANSVQAANMLKKASNYEKKSLFLLRYSRANPDMFVISYINIIDKQVFHVRLSPDDAVKRVDYMEGLNYKRAEYYLDNNAVMANAYRWAQTGDYGFRNHYGYFD